MLTRERVVVLVVIADRSVQTLCKCGTFSNGIGQDHARTGEDHRKFGGGQEPRRLGYCLRTTRWPLEFNWRWQRYIYHLRPEVPRNVDLGRRRQSLRLANDSIEHFR